MYSLIPVKTTWRTPVRPAAAATRGKNQLTLRVERVVRDGDAAGLQNPVIGDDELRRVGQVDGDRCPLAHAQPLQTGGEAAGQHIEFGVGDLPAEEGQRGEASV